MSHKPPRPHQARPDENDIDNDHDGHDDTPLQHQRAFGSGLYRKAIAFVPDSELRSVDDSGLAEKANKNNKPAQDVADLYLSMVLPEDTAKRSKSAPPSSSSSSSHAHAQQEQGEETCPICNLPLGADAPPQPGQKAPTPHAQSLAHQLSLPHSHPPSALDRRRMGFAYLAAHGWDPDARRGLGAQGQGITHPVKPRAKVDADDKLGIGVKVPSKEELAAVARKREQERNKGRLLDAKKVRKLATEERARGEKIRRELFGDGRLEKYLGSGATW